MKYVIGILVGLAAAAAFMGILFMLSTMVMM